MKRIILISIVVIVSHNLFAQVNNYVRFDGLYQSEIEGDSLRYSDFLRFYEDGTVCNICHTVGRDKLGIYLYKENNSGIGEYEIKTNKVYFTCVSDFGSVVYDGEIISEYKIKFNIKSLINGNESTKMYYFLKFNE